MIRADRPAAVRRWLRRPLLWAMGAVVLAGWLAFVEARDDRRTDREFAAGMHVEARPDEDWDGGRALDVFYTHPSGQVVVADTYVSRPELLPDPDQPVTVVVSDRDPSSVRLVGDDTEPSRPWLYLLIAVPFLLAWAVRRWTVHQTSRLAGSDAPAFQMRAVASSPGWWSWRWRLHLYALDSPRHATPVCTVPLIAAPGALGERMVEAKGTPRPWGQVVARDQASGEVLWPSGRGLRVHGWGRRSLEPGRLPEASPTPRRLMVGGLTVMAVAGVIDIFVEDSLDSENRGYRVDAEIVRSRGTDEGFDTEVRVDWLGEEIDAIVHTSDRESVEGSIEVLLDPVHPSRVWAPGEDAPGGSILGFVYLLALLVVVVGAVMRILERRRDRAPRPAAFPPPYPARLPPPR